MDKQSRQSNAEGQEDWDADCVHVPVPCIQNDKTRQSALGNSESASNTSSRVFYSHRYNNHRAENDGRSRQLRPTDDKIQRSTFSEDVSAPQSDATRSQLTVLSVTQSQGEISQHVGTSSHRPAWLGRGRAHNDTVGMKGQKSSGHVGLLRNNEHGQNQTHQGGYNLGRQSRDYERPRQNSHFERSQNKQARPQLGGHLKENDPSNCDQQNQLESPSNNQNLLHNADEQHCGQPMLDTCPILRDSVEGSQSSNNKLQAAAEGSEDWLVSRSNRRRRPGKHMKSDRDLGFQQNVNYVNSIEEDHLRYCKKTGDRQSENGQYYRQQQKKNWRDDHPQQKNYRQKDSNGIDKAEQELTKPILVAENLNKTADGNHSSGKKTLWEDQSGAKDNNPAFKGSDRCSQKSNSTSQGRGRSHQAPELADWIEPSFSHRSKNDNKHEAGNKLLKTLSTGSTVLPHIKSEQLEEMSISESDPFPPLVLQPNDESASNFWKNRQDFLNGAQPATEDEEAEMLRKALEESQKLAEERKREMLAEEENLNRCLQESKHELLCHSRDCVDEQPDSEKERNTSDIEDFEAATDSILNPKSWSQVPHCSDTDDGRRAFLPLRYASPPPVTCDSQLKITYKSTHIPNTAVQCKNTSAATNCEEMSSDSILEFVNCQVKQSVPADQSRGVCDRGAGDSMVLPENSLVSDLGFSFIQEDLTQGLCSESPPEVIYQAVAPESRDKSMLSDCDSDSDVASVVANGPQNASSAPALGPPPLSSNQLMMGTRTSHEARANALPHLVTLQQSTVGTTACQTGPPLSSTASLTSDFKSCVSGQSTEIHNMSTLEDKSTVCLVASEASNIAVAQGSELAPPVVTASIGGYLMQPSGLHQGMFTMPMMPYPYLPGSTLPASSPMAMLPMPINCQGYPAPGLPVYPGWPYYMPGMMVPTAGLTSVPPGLHAPRGLPSDAATVPMTVPMRPWLPQGLPMYPLMSSSFPVAPIAVPAPPVTEESLCENCD